MEPQKFILTSDNPQRRLDQELRARYPDFSRSYFETLIKEGFVLLNEKRGKKREIVKPGDVVEVTFKEAEPLRAQAENIPLDILFEDEQIIVVNKAPGMVVHPAPGNNKNTFVNALLYHLGDHDFDDPVRPGIVHRLDKETSGVLLAAKSRQVHAKLVESFSRRKVEKEYLAICMNKPAISEVELPIGRDSKDRKKMCISEKGKWAKTLLTPLNHNHMFSLVKAEPISGRTHQIRVHLTHLGCPILGDSLYGNLSMNHKYEVQRQLLHAESLTFSHPLSQKRLTIKAPLPQDIEAWIKLIRT